MCVIIFYNAFQIQFQTIMSIVITKISLAGSLAAESQMVLGKTQFFLAEIVASNKLNC